MLHLCESPSDGTTFSLNWFYLLLRHRRKLAFKCIHVQWCHVREQNKSFDRGIWEKTCETDVRIGFTLIYQCFCSTSRWSFSGKLDIEEICSKIIEWTQQKHSEAESSNCYIRPTALKMLYKFDSSGGESRFRRHLWWGRKWKPFWSSTL